MNDSKEKFSAFLDDELNIEELALLQDNQADESKTGLALRYQLIGDAMRGEVSDASLVNVSAQVSENLHHVIPDRVETAVRQESGRSSRAAIDFSAWFAPFMRPLGGLAVAASVALVTVIAVTQVDNAPSELSSVVADADSHKVNIPPTAVVSRPVARAVLANAVPGKDNKSRRNAAYLDAYLTEHVESAARDTMQGRMPYARAVSYESK